MLIVQCEKSEAAPVSLEQFLIDNEGDDHVCEAVKGLKPGQSVNLGGGAAPMLTVTAVRPRAEALLAAEGRAAAKGAPVEWIPPSSSSIAIGQADEWLRIGTNEAHICLFASGNVIISAQGHGVSAFAAASALALAMAGEVLP